LVFRFSGHDTFHCREQWLYKGVNLLKDNEKNDKFSINNLDNISKLGVGKNMLRGISHWIKSFGLSSDSEAITEIAAFLFLNEKTDPYLEKIGTPWLLQYMICKCNYATIYKLFFTDFFQSRISNEFTQNQISAFINRHLENNEKKVNQNTLKSDIKVLLKNYLKPKRNDKTIEEDYSAIFTQLNLVSATGRHNENKEEIYILNKQIQNELPVEIFFYSVLDYYNSNIVSFEKLNESIASFFCLSNQGLEEMIEKTVETFKNVSYKSDAGIKQLHIDDIYLSEPLSNISKYYRN